MLQKHDYAFFSVSKTCGENTNTNCTYFQSQVTILELIYIAKFSAKMPATVTVAILAVAALGNVTKNSLNSIYCKIAQGSIEQSIFYNTHNAAVAVVVAVAVTVFVIVVVTVIVAVTVIVVVTVTVIVAVVVAIVVTVVVTVVVAVVVAVVVVVAVAVAVAVTVAVTVAAAAAGFLFHKILPY